MTTLYSENSNLTFAYYVQGGPVRPNGFWNKIRV